MSNAVKSFERVIHYMEKNEEGVYESSSRHVVRAISPRPSPFRDCLVDVEGVEVTVEEEHAEADQLLLDCLKPST